MTDKPTVTISFHVEADLDLTIEEAFPDGLPEGLTPETLSAEDVRASVRERERSFDRWVREWGVESQIDVSVTVERAVIPFALRAGLDPLPGLPPAQIDRTRTTADVFGPFAR